jgi:hydroxymethyl cephem carbamoyltransferase
VIATVNVLSVKPGHDGTIAFISDGRLVFSLEAEKDSFPRYSDVTAQLLIDAMTMAPAVPDVLAVSGWHKIIPGFDEDLGAGYYGTSPGQLREGKIFGRRVVLFSSSHERSHILGAAAMHPEAPLHECAVLLWEGRLGAFYHWTDGGASIRRTPVMTEPGARWSALFALADPTFPPSGSNVRHEYAGKLMALTAYHRDEILTEEQRSTVDRLLSAPTFYPFDKRAYADSSLHDCGIPDPGLCAAARYLSDRIFEAFMAAAKARIPPGLPLLVTGGCGLNCEWNRRWLEDTHFSDVFVPPCANDTGSSIGTAADAMVHLGSPCRLEWSVYCGAEFERDAEPAAHTWAQRRADPDRLADRLASGAVIPWVQGRCEVGPRALGHRSLLASPLEAGMHADLNRIKRREGYRPIAPCCRSEELHEWFDPPIDDPFMLFFSHVKTPDLPAITHADGSARVQAVRRSEVPALHEVLTAVKTRTGYGVLCNTSLNFTGLGFINRMSDLVRYCDAAALDNMVVGGDWFVRAGSDDSSP